MNTKLNIVLDIAGVIATNFSPILWKDLSSRFGVAYDDLIKFRQENRDDLWTGKIEEQEFWVRLVRRFPTIDKEYATNKLLSAIKPLPALEEIPFWSKHANIHLLSNHRTEWVDHIIRPIQDYIKSVTISGDVGVCKPQIDIYLKVHSLLDNENGVLFVDDQEKNLTEARNLGWHTLLADDKGKWTKRVVQYL